MVDQELLEALGQMITASEERTAHRLDAIDKRLTDLTESVTEIRDSTNYIADWVQNLEDDFTAHRIKTNE